MAPKAVKTPKMLKRTQLTIGSLLLVLVLAACGQPSTPALSLFAKQGVSLKIPTGWAATHDSTISQGHRQLIFSSPDDLRLTIDILDRPALDIDPFFAEVLSQAAAPHPLSHPGIIQGNAQRKRTLGYYAVINIQTTPAIARFMETLVLEENQALIYLTFSSPLDDKDRLKSLIEPMLNSITIKSL